MGSLMSNINVKLLHLTLALRKAK
uniref:Uncharacterized protein n=1 Tax=Anguilla anguilla TaxID=7936 RepID=A0A0E9W8Z4_ANGAN